MSSSKSFEFHEFHGLHEPHEVELELRRYRGESERVSVAGRPWGRGATLLALLVGWVGGWASGFVFVHTDGTFTLGTAVAEGEWPTKAPRCLVRRGGTLARSDTGEGWGQA